jgi:hypothetical protein
VSATRVPDFLYVGTSKAGSTWLFNALAVHRDVHLASSKGLYYFDQHFDRGLDWYLGQFEGAPADAPAGEISHSYLSSPEAPERIAELNPRMKLLVCLREPVDRAFSDYLDLIKNQRYDGPFESALEKFPGLLDRGRYATHLNRYLEHFPREQMLVQLFDELKADPQRYADEVYDFLGVRRWELPPTELKSRMPAGTPRSPMLARSAKAASLAAKRVGLTGVRSRVKRSVRVRQALYRPYADDRPTIDPSTAERLRSEFAAEVRQLDGLLGFPVAERWGYREAPSGSQGR